MRRLVNEQSKLLGYAATIQRGRMVLASSALLSGPLARPANTCHVVAWNELEDETKS